MTRRRLDGDPAQLGELSDSGPAAEAAVAGRLHAAERHLRLVLHRGGVDVADARLDALRELDAARDVAGEDRGRQTVLGIVRELDGLVGRSDAGDRDLRAERLLTK